MNLTKLNRERLEKLFSNAIEYLWEVKDCGCYDTEELKEFWSKTIGLTDEEIKEFELIEGLQ